MSRYKSSPGNMRDFINSSVWTDVKTELEEALSMLRESLEVAADFEAVLRLQGSCDTIRRVMVMPDVILEDMEALKEKGVAETFKSKGE